MEPKPSPPGAQTQGPPHHHRSTSSVAPSPIHHRSVPASPTQTRPASSYYDPTKEERAGNRDAGANSTSYQPPSPQQTRTHFEQPPPAPYANGHHAEQRPAMSRHPSQSSPPTSAHAHPVPPPPADARSQAPPRSTNPMSMMNLLSDDTASTPAPPPTREEFKQPAPVLPPAPALAPPPPPAAPAPAKAASRKASRASSASHQSGRVKDGVPPPLVAPQHAPPIAVPQTGPPSLTIRDTEAAYKEIEQRDLSDVEADMPGIEGPKVEWVNRTHKRALDLEIAEQHKRKRRRLELMQKYHDHFSAASDTERSVFVDQHEHEVTEEVRLKEVEEDKERKKDQQRKRRREKAIADEQQKREEVIQQIASTQDDEEKERLQREVARHDKKIRDTQSRLQGITPSKEFRNESPHNAAALGRQEREVNLDGGLMTSFYSNSRGPVNDEVTPEFSASGRGRGRGGRGGGTGRARKSKEQKLAEKENARQAQAYIDQGLDLPQIAPATEERLQAYGDRVLPRQLQREDSEPLSEIQPTMYDMQPTAGLTGMAKFESKGYNQIYEQISRDLAKQVPKVTRIKNNSLDTKQSNARKTAQLAAKEARRWQLRTNKSTKDVAARAKRAMREMLGFWKRNERDEREGRKVAERAELDKAKKQEAEREANRQKRKLNFLISQTELYSHFIGKKVKTDEIERHGTDADGTVSSGQTTRDNPNATQTIDLPDSVANPGKKVTNFEDLDFDAEDESALQAAAAANAQHAINEAKQRAIDFNKPDDDGQNLSDAQANFDEGEMNFQNPTSLQSMDVAQPKMLSCQLKEYQLKGLNWLVNLYEQGINGILADEMGLGKTVQSISVMAYLAEVHDIWGPFLVIAPASTLHNWQQEIAKFVPSIKTLPYWGSAKDRKVLRKFWDRKHITYNRDSPFHVLVTSYQLVVQDTAYFQKVKWQYMILDEAQAIKSSQSSRWKSLLGFSCRNRLLLTGTPIQNNMQELWALLHFIMPSLFDSHDEFSEWFSKDIENHAQSNSKLNEDQLRRLHMILKPFMLRRIKKHVQKELGDKIELDVFCDLTYRQRAYYTNLRNKISIMDLIEKAAVGDDQDTATLMNLVMQFRKVCNHPDLFERADTWSPMSMSYYAETASFMREGNNVNVAYSVRNLIEYWLPTMLGDGPGRLDLPGPDNAQAGWRNKVFSNDLSIWSGEHIKSSQGRRQDGKTSNGAFSWLRFVDQSAEDVIRTARSTLMQRVVVLAKENDTTSSLKVAYDDEEEQENAGFTPVHAMLNIVKRNARKPLAEITSEGHLNNLLNISSSKMAEQGYSVIETCYLPPASAPPIELVCPGYRAQNEKESAFFDVPLRRALYPISTGTEEALLRAKLPPSKYPVTNMLPEPESEKQRYTKIQVPSMRRFVTDSGKLAKLDQLLRELKEGGHRVLLYFQMTRMIDLMEEYLTYRNYRYCRLDGSTKLEDRRDTVAAFQADPSIFVFLLSTRAGGLGINLTSADTVIFYDSDWNPTIDSQAMDRAHRLGQTRQVTVYRLITRGTIEERIRKRALQKEEVQRVVISGQAGSSNVVDFNNRSRESNRTKEMAMWLADDDQVEAIERREAQVMEEEAKSGGKKKRKNAATNKRKEVSMDELYHEGEGKFDDGASHEPSGAATPVSAMEGPPAKKRKGTSKKAKTVKQRLAVIDGEV
ncbi:Chromatin-remodeling ATPase INO80 [Fulvia fulva]|nr:Chromatin-remodeling ATPase INO80 [Fulvia fulva]KAK4623265.1 Chromatin-remodeling ATPase INO80 [Fulvia fulva]WPV16285.1 Chromatin-remodeling ATPase INO80 [Fulvia fulva]WPV30642.1 Chromatin-remodeling ATPase INO80 [Fulvia fulva]